MATCPECDAEIEVDEFDVDKGDLISCPDCGSNLEVIGLSPVELEMADDEDDDEDDDDDEARRRRRGRCRRRRRRGRGRRRRKKTGTSDPRRRPAETTAAPVSSRRPRPSTRGSRLSGRCSSPTAAASTARFWPSPPTRVLGERALCVTADSPSYPDHHRDLAIGTARAFDLRHEMVAHRRGRAPGLPRQPREPLLLLQARALHAPDGDRARARLRRRRRRQQRRRPRRLPARPAGGARVRRPQPARRGRPDQGRHPRAGAARRACRPGTSRRRRACRRAFRITPKSPRRSCGRSTRPSACCATSASASAACAITTRSRGSSSAATEMARALEPEVAATIDRELRALGYAHVTVDLRGYRLGSLNEALKLRPV